LSLFLSIGSGLFSLSLFLLECFLELLYLLSFLTSCYGCGESLLCCNSLLLLLFSNALSFFGLLLFFESYGLYLLGLLSGESSSLGPVLLCCSILFAKSLSS
jgi:hypothetical protein